MNRILGLLLACSCLSAVVGDAQVVNDSSFVIPVVAKINGDTGTHWVSDLVLSNVTSADIGFHLFFLREGQSNRAPTVWKSLDSHEPVWVSLSVEGGQTLMVDDVLGTLFPEQGSGVKGFLFAMPDDIWTPGDEPLLAVSSRTYNVGQPGLTYGQTVPAAAVEFVTGPGRAEIPGVVENAARRTNIGVVNFSAIELPILIEVFDSSGNLVHQTNTTVPDFSLGQWGLDDLGAADLDLGRATVRIDPDLMTWDPCSTEGPFEVPPSVGRFLAYFSKIDRVTGDAEFGYAQVNWTEYEALCGIDPGDCWGW